MYLQVSNDSNFWYTNYENIKSLWRNIPIINYNYNGNNQGSDFIAPKILKYAL